MYANLQRRPNINQEQYQNLLNNQEKHIDYDIIKEQRDKWINNFRGLTAEKARYNYDEMLKAIKLLGENELEYHNQ